MRFGNYHEKEFDTVNPGDSGNTGGTNKHRNDKYDHQDDTCYIKNEWGRPSNVDPRNNTQSEDSLFLDDHLTPPTHTNTDGSIKSTWCFKVEDSYHTNPLQPPMIHRIIVGFDDPNQVQDDTTDEFLDDLNERDWIDNESTDLTDGEYGAIPDFCCECCCAGVGHGNDQYYYDDSYDEVNDLYDFYNEILNQYHAARDRHEADVEDYATWTQEDDPVDELANRLSWVTSGLLTGDLDLSSAMEAIDNVYDGIEDDLNAIVDNDKRPFNEHEVGPIGSESNKKNGPEATHACGCSSGDLNGLDDCRGREYDTLCCKLTQLSWYLRKLREVLDLTEDPDTDPDVNANKAGMLIEAIVHAIVWDDLLADALQNPDDDLERDFNKGCLEEDCVEMIKLLSHSKTNYVVGYAIRTWMNRLNDQVIGGLEAITGDHPVLRRLDNGRLIID